MKEEVRKILLRVNQIFYDDFSSSFGASRGQPWPAWNVLFDELDSSETVDSDSPLRILDVGCGNGRFGTLASERLQRPLAYFGLDQSQGLLDQARAKLEGVVEELHLEQLDLGDPSATWPELGDGFDVICIFGVLHHLPGEAMRRALLTRLGRHLKPGARFWASWWMLHRTSRFSRKVIPWQQLEKKDPTLRAPASDELEPGDTLLSWQRDGFGLRYLHFPEADELQRLGELPELNLVRTLESDGPTGQENLYLIWTC